MSKILNGTDNPISMYQCILSFGLKQIETQLLGLGTSCLFIKIYEFTTITLSFISFYSLDIEVCL